MKNKHSFLKIILLLIILVSTCQAVLADNPQKNTANSAAANFTAPEALAGGKVTIPSKVTTVPTYAFYNDTSLDNVFLPSGVTTISSYAFANSSVKFISIPDSVVSIASNAFSGASQLNTVFTPYQCEAYSQLENMGIVRNTRALVIGENRFLRVCQNDDGSYSYCSDYADRNVGDATNLESKLANLGNQLSADFQVTNMTDVSYSGIKSAIQNTFSGTTDKDVSLFFIATHGNSDGDGELEMPFLGSSYEEADAFYKSGNGEHFLPFSTLASWLSTYVKGEVIVLIESCGAGSAIYSSSEQNSTRELFVPAVSNSPKVQETLSLAREAQKKEYDPDSFLQSAIDAFEDEELKIRQTDANLSVVPNEGVGALRKSKYFVLAAARHHEMSWGQGNSTSDPMNYFTLWLLQGIGSKSDSPADANGDKMLDLTELFNYVKSVGDNQAFCEQRDSSGNCTKYAYQHVQRYPVNSRQVLFMYNW